jgi:hypothetical protein
MSTSRSSTLRSSILPFHSAARSMRITASPAVTKSGRDAHGGLAMRRSRADKVGNNDTAKDTLRTETGRSSTSDSSASRARW